MEKPSKNPVIRSNVVSTCSSNPVKTRCEPFPANPAEVRQAKEQQPTLKKPVPCGSTQPQTIQLDEPHRNPPQNPIRRLSLDHDRNQSFGTDFYRVLPGFTGFYWVLLSFTGYFRVLLGFTGFYRVFTDFYRFLPIFTEFYRVSIAATRFNEPFPRNHLRISSFDRFSSR